MIRSTFPRSRKLRYCDDCRERIKPGTIYRNVVASPDHDDLGNGGWWRASICRECDRRYDRLDGWPAAPIEGDDQ